MAAPASYGWNVALITPVSHTETVVVPAPDINDNVDQDSAELAVDGNVIPEDKFDIVFDIPNAQVIVTNLTTKEWHAQSNVYVSAQRISLSGGTLEGMSQQLDDHEARISALEAASAPAARR
jgi:hypothetical protein